MTKRLKAFIQAIINLMACIIIMHAIDLSVQHDPDLRDVELWLMSVISLLCLCAFAYHAYDALFPRITFQLPATEGWDGD